MRLFAIKGKNLCFPSRGDAERHQRAARYATGVTHEIEVIELLSYNGNPAKRIAEEYALQCSADALECESREAAERQQHPRGVTR